VGGGRSLVIVESPAKAITIGRFLGNKFTVRASMGHVRDLPDGKLGVDTENSFEPAYQIMKDKKTIVAELKKLGANATRITNWAKAGGSAWMHGYWDYDWADSYRKLDSVVPVTFKQFRAIVDHMSRTSKRGAELAEILARDHTEIGDIAVGAIWR
jgi:hypothetical protein